MEKGLEKSGPFSLINRDGVVRCYFTLPKLCVVDHSRITRTRARSGKILKVTFAKKRGGEDEAACHLPFQAQGGLGLRNKYHCAGSSLVRLRCLSSKWRADSGRDG